MKQDTESSLCDLMIRSIDKSAKIRLLSFVTGFEPQVNLVCLKMLDAVLYFCQ